MTEGVQHRGDFPRKNLITKEFALRGCQVQKSSLKKPSSIINFAQNTFIGTYNFGCDFLKIILLFLEVSSCIWMVLNQFLNLTHFYQFEEKAF